MATALPGYLDELVEGLRRLIPTAIRDNDVDAIHDARVATRRLKAALDLLETTIDHRRLRPFARTLRKLRRRLGPLRDLDVMGDHLIELKKDATDDQQKAIAWLEIRLQNARKLSVHDARDSAPPGKMLAKLGTWWGVRDDITAAADVTNSLLTDSLARQLATFSRESNRLISPEPAADQLNPHAIRIAGKSLRYTLEMARVQGFDFDGDVFKSFKQMQDALGLWHDFIVLTERMLAISGGEQLAHHDAPTQRAILGLAQVTLRKSEDQLDRFAQLWTERGPAISDAIARVATDRAASALQTDLDPSGSTRTADPAAQASDAPEAA